MALSIAERWLSAITDIQQRMMIRQNCGIACGARNLPIRAAYRVTGPFTVEVDDYHHEGDHARLRRASEEVLIFSGVSGLIANHPSFPSSKAYQKSGAFPPLALPGFNGTVPLSDSRPIRRHLRR